MRKNDVQKYFLRFVFADSAAAVIIYLPQKVQFSVAWEINLLKNGDFI